MHYNFIRKVKGVGTKDDDILYLVISGIVFIREPGLLIPYVNQGLASNEEQEILAKEVWSKIKIEIFSIVLIPLYIFILSLC